MSRIPSVESEEQIQPAPVNTSFPALNQLNQLGSFLQQKGNQLIDESARDYIKTSAQNAATDIQMRAQQLKNEVNTKYDNPIDQQQNFTQRFQAFSKAYIASLPIGARDYSDKVFKHTLLVNTALYNNKISKQHNTDVKLNYGIQQNNRVQLMNESVATGDIQSAANTYKDIVQQSELAASHNIITPEDAIKTVKDAKTSMQSSNFLVSVRNALQNNDFKQASNNIRQLILHGVPGFSQQDVLTLANRGQKMVNEFKSASQIDSVSINNNAKTNLANILEKGVENPQWTQSYVKAFPDKADAYLKEVAQNHEIFSTVTNLLTTSPPQQTQILATIRQTKDAPEYTKILSAFSTQQKAIQRNPYQYNLTHPAVEAAFIRKERLQSADLDSPYPVEQFQQTDPVTANRLAQEAEGIQNIQVMHPAEVTQIISQFNSPSTTLQQRVGTLEKLASDYGDNFSYLSKQFHRAGMDFINPLVFNSIRSSPQNAPVLYQAFSTPINELKKVTPNFKDIDEIFKSDSNPLTDYLTSINYIGLSDGARQKVINSVRHLAYQFNVNGDDPDTAAQKSADMLFNQHYDYTHIYNGLTRIPKDVDSDIVRFNAHALMAKAINTKSLKVPPFYLPGIPNDLRETLYKQDLAHNGDVVTLPDDSGIYVTDWLGNKVRSSENLPFETTFRDIRNPDFEATNARLEELKSIRNISSIHPFSKVKQANELLQGVPSLSKDAREGLVGISQALLPGFKAAKELDKLLGKGDSQ